jgi:hypothetical protein
MQTPLTQQHANKAIAQEHAPEYLDCLRALARELDRAMHSLADNTLGAFEDSVQRQLALCARLSSLVARHNAAPVVGASGTAPTDEELSQRIADARANLLVLNRTYSALLRHSGRTMQMFAGLAKCYGGYPQPGVAASPNLSTWSSQI